MIRINDWKVCMRNKKEEKSELNLDKKVPFEMI